MRISSTSSYAIGAMLQLAKSPPGVPVPSSKLAKVGEMPERFLLQVLCDLVNHGLLKSARGVEGGYSLARTANQISLLQILEATEGPLIPEVPPLECIPHTAHVHLQEVLQKITTDTCRHLAGVQLADLPVPQANEDDTATNLG